MKKRHTAVIIIASLFLSIAGIATGNEAGRSTQQIITLILSARGSVGDLVWDDNGDGIHDTGEPGVAGVRVFADLNEDGTYSAGEPSAITDAEGAYEIAGLKKGTYAISVDASTLPVGYLVITHQPLSIKTFKHKINDSADFALQNRSAGLNGYLWNDSNGNATFDSNESPIANVIIYVDLDNDDTRSAGDPLATTADNGSYQIQQIPVGAYKVHVDNGSLPSEFHRTPVAGANPTNVTFASNTNETVNFGYQQKSEIHGILRDASGNPWVGTTLYIDLNGNGQWDPGEPTAITDKYGYYSFGDLLPGTYLIQVMPGQLPPDYILVLAPGPVTVTGEGEQYTANFITQTKLGAVHNLKSPVRVSWGGDGNLYVSDSGNDAVFIYDSSLNVQSELKKLGSPLAVNADASGNIYVGSLEGKNVLVYSASGDLTRTIGDGTITVPNDIALDNSNNIYVLDSSKGNILIFDQNGNLQSTISGSGKIGYGVSIAISYVNDANGELYVADQKNCTIHVYSLNGTYKKSIGKRGTNYMTTNWDGLFSGLMSVAVDSTGNIHGLDNNLDLVQVFDATGAFVRSYDAFTAENTGKLNLQLDFSLNPTDNRTVMANAATSSIETIQ